MAIFATQYTKLGNIWPLDYLTIMPTGETIRFRLKRRDGDCLMFVNADGEDTRIYTGKLKNQNGTSSECCTIDYNSTTLQLKADVCKLACCNATWKERKEIIMKLKE
jgi:hypothetical protein